MTVMRLLPAKLRTDGYNISYILAVSTMFGKH